jgi:2-dehydro-3-deoxyphosphooctonate aldolase (KDO 8-P synthase)
MLTRSVRLGSRVRIGGGAPLALIAGPCVIEGEAFALRLAERLASLARRRRIPFVFKASFDKANRTSGASFRGPGLGEGLRILARVRRETGVPVTTDVHETRQVPAAAEAVDLLQIPAFLARQTDLLAAAGRAGRPVNLKKAQFMAPEDMAHAVAKVRAAGARDVLVTERGTSFGYHNLVVDMRSLESLRRLPAAVVFDATHSVQRPAGLGASSGGDREYVPALVRAACAVGVDALFLEVHPDPARAKSDGANAWPLRDLEALWDQALAADRAARTSGAARLSRAWRRRP